MLGRVDRGFKTKYEKEKMSSRTVLYDLLGVSSDASTEEIKVRYFFEIWSRLESVPPKGSSIPS